MSVFSGYECRIGAGKEVIDVALTTFRSAGALHGAKTVESHIVKSEEGAWLEVKIL